MEGAAEGLRNHEGVEDSDILEVGVYVEGLQGLGFRV